MTSDDRVLRLGAAAGRPVIPADEAASEPHGVRVEEMQGLLRDGRRVPVRIQHSLLTGVVSGSL